MSKLTYLLFAVITFACFSCKKKYPESVTKGEAVFFVNGTIDGMPLNLSAGNDNYFMYSSFEQGAGSVYQFIADLRRKDCPETCPNSLRIMISDFKMSQPNAPVNIDSSLKPSKYSLKAGPVAMNVQFKSSFNKPLVSYNWDFGDGTFSSEANPLHSYARKGKYTVKLTANPNGQYYSSISGMHKINSSATNLSAFVSESSKSGTTINFAANVSGPGPYSYYWNFGDGTTSTLANPSRTYNYAGSYQVYLRVINGSDTAMAIYNAVTQNDNSSSAVNYTINSVAEIPNTQALSSIVIKWVDGNGIEYTTDNELQPTDSFFEIVSVEDFINNENKERTKKLHLKFKCKVYNGTSIKTIDNAEATVCISYK